MIGTDGSEADRQEQQEEVTEEPRDDDSGEVLESATLEANEADVVEQAQPVYEDEDYPRGPADEVPI